MKDFLNILKTGGVLNIIVQVFCMKGESKLLGKTLRSDSTHQDKQY